MPHFVVMPTLVVSATLSFLVGNHNTNAADPVVVASSGKVPNLRQPQAAVSSSGKVFVTFGAEEEIYFCRSTDRGRTFSAPMKIGQVPKLALGMRRGPRIIACADLVVIAAISH